MSIGGTISLGERVEKNVCEKEVEWREVGCECADTHGMESKRKE